MWNKLLCLLSVIFLFSMMPTARAAFFVKKQACISGSQAIAAIAASQHTALKSEDATHTLSNLKHVMHPSSAVAFYYRGWIGFAALVFGIAGFFYGGFGIAAILFGLIGMGRRHKSRGLAIAGLVLGVVAIAVSIFATFSGFPIF